jgi:hypothetical protein
MYVKHAREVADTDRHNVSMLCPKDTHVFYDISGCAVREGQQKGEEPILQSKE